MNDTWEIISLQNRDTNIHRYHNSVSQVRTNGSDVFGRIGYTFNLDLDNCTDEEYNVLLESLQPEFFSRSISIDSRFLYDENILNRIANSDRIREIRITDPGFMINEDLLNRFSNNVTLVADRASETAIRSGRAIPQYGIFKKEKNYVGNDLTSAYFVDHDLSDDELNYLVSAINNDHEENRQLSLRIYRPSMYEEFLRRLRDRGLDSNVEINLLGNPLYDASTCFDEISGIVNNRVNITYDICSDVVEMYCHEPFSVSNLHRSELEGGGKSSIESYHHLLSILENQESHIRQMGYSPLEAQIYLYRFLQENYAYDPNLERTDSIDFLANRQLDRVAGSPTLVCEGYATLYSALMRRCGMPVFRYSTENHVRNIARIKDDKYGVDTIGVLDPTEDGSHIVDGAFEQNRAFTYFMVSPRDMLRSNNPECMTIPTSLVLDREHLEMWPFSRDVYEFMFDDEYSPIGYAVTMLDRMGFDVQDSNGNFSMDSYNNLLDNLNRTSIFDELDSSAFENAYIEVMRKENPQISDEEINMNLGFANLSRSLRYSDYSNRPTLLLNYDINQGRLVPSIGIDENGNQFNNNRTIDVGFRVHDNSRRISDFELSDEEINRRRREVINNRNSFNNRNLDNYNVGNGINENRVTNSSNLNIGDGINGSDINRNHIGTISDIFDENHNSFNEEFINDAINDVGRDVFIDIAGGINAVSIGDRVESTSMDNLRIMIDTNNDILTGFGSNNNDEVIIDVYESGEFIPGTTIRKPRFRGDYETDEEYVNYLENYYNRYFPQASQTNRNIDRNNNINPDGTYRLVREQIVQDLPINSRQESRYR